MGARLNGRKNVRAGFFRPLKRAPNLRSDCVPPAKTGGYGSYDGYAADYGAIDLSRVGGEAAMRTVAPSFELGNSSGRAIS